MTAPGQRAVIAAVVFAAVGCARQDGLGVKFQTEPLPAGPRVDGAVAASREAGGMTVTVLESKDSGTNNSARRLVDAVCARLDAKPKRARRGYTLLVADFAAHHRVMEYPDRASATMKMRCQLLEGEAATAATAFSVALETHSIAVVNKTRAQQMDWIWDQALQALADEILDQIE